MECEQNGRTRRTRENHDVDPAAGGGEVYANCDAVRAAGAAPLQRGTAAYAANPGLDRDGDGTACE